MITSDTITRIMSDKVLITAIICVTIVGLGGLYFGLDGAVFFPVVSAIGGLGGYHIGTGTPPSNDVGSSPAAE